LGNPDDREPCRRDHHTKPLPATEVETEEPLGEHTEEDQPG
jgi:hypothetical protein